MASTTSFLGTEFRNLGPLTTTFTAPSSCATVNTDQVFFVSKERPLFGLGRPKCNDTWTNGDCLPSGTALDSMLEKFQASSPTAVNYFPYYSPGIACPSGWGTIGMLSKPNGTLSASGYFTETSIIGADITPWPTTGARPIQETDMWNGILKPSETIAFCGPTGTGWEVWPDGSYRSTLGDIEDLGYSTMCNVWTEDDPTATDPPMWVTISSVSGFSYEHGIISFPDQTADGKVVTTYETIVGSAAARQPSDVAVVTQGYPIALIYQQSDLDAAGSTTASQATETATEASGTATESAETVANAGPVLSVRSAVPIITVMLSMLAGAGLMAPW